MTKRTLSTLSLVAAAVLSGSAMADFITISGVLDDTDPTYDVFDTGSSVLTHYDTIEFTVDADGVYGFYSFYPGDTSIDENLDGVLSLYESSFDPNSPAGTIGFDDDYNSGDVAQLAPFDAGAVGSNASGFEAALTAGTTYIVVQSSFTDTPTSFGQPTGAYDMTITGPGTITVVPAPAAGLALLGLGGLAARRRRRG